jgi:hypothetical protein
MIPTKTAHRLVAVLAIPAFLLVSACGSDDGGGDAGGDGGAAAATVSGKAGEQPVIEVDENAEIAADTRVEVIEEGDGAEIAEGDYFRADVLGTTMAGEELFSTWPQPEEEAGDGPRRQYVARTGEEGMLPQTIVDTLVGQQVGSRVLVEGQAGTLIGPQVTQAGMAEDDGLVWVFDIVGSGQIDPQGEVEGEQAPVEDGLPEVTAGDGEAAEVTVPEGADPPTELVEQVLIAGDGAEVESGQGLVVQYTGVKWEDGETFDASYNREAASAFQIGTGSVVAGWDAGLTGKHVGDRLLLVIPSDQAYGGQPDHELAENTLIFVVDILGVI